MKKLFLLLLFVTGFLQAQTLPSPSYNLTTTNTLKVKTNTESVTGTNKIPVQETDGIVNYIQSINIPVPYIPTNYSPTTQTLKGQLEGINTKLGAAQTTAGNTARVRFTADNVTVNLVDYFQSSISGAGSTAAGSPPTLSLADNTKLFFTKDVISILQPTLVKYPPGIYAGQLTVSATPTPNATQQRFTVEIYKTDSNGVAIASGVAGAPIGSLGVAVIMILDSQIINLVAGSITNVSVSGQLLAELTVNPNERIKYHVSAAKVGTGGGNVTAQVYYGSNYNSYYDVPIADKASTTINDAIGVAGLTVADALVSITTNKEDKSNKATNFSVVNDILYPTVKAAKDYADNLVVGLLNDRGGYDASGNVYPTTGGSGAAGSILKGNLWSITVPGTLGGVAVSIGDWVRALSSYPGQTAGNWSVVEGNFGYVAANDSNVLHKTGSEVKNGALNISTSGGVAPLAPIHIGNRNVINSVNAQSLVAGNYNNSIIGNGHAFSDGSNLSKSGLWAYASYDARVDITGTGVSSDHYVGFQHAPVYTFTGNISKNWGLYTTTDIRSGTIDNNYGVYAANPIKSGTGAIGVNFGLYIENQTAGTSNYGLYSAGGRNYLGGEIVTDGTVFANMQGGNIRFKFDGTINDGGIIAGGDGSFYFSDWSISRGLKIKPNGAIEVLGVNTLTAAGIIIPSKTNLDAVMGDGSTRSDFIRYASTLATRQIVMGSSVSSIENSSMSQDVSGNISVSGKMTALPATVGTELVTLDQLNAAAPSGVKRYKALISQTGTSAPTVIVLENSIGTITFGYSSVGGYTISSSGLFTVDKTFWNIPSGPNGNNTNSINQATASLMYLWSTNVVTGVNVNNGMADTPILIEVYP